jgi:hypothetical protein
MKNFERDFFLPEYGKLKCPGCGCDIDFAKPGSITVNIHSTQEVTIPNFWIPTEGCTNPNCEWSKLDKYSMNFY